MTFFNLSTNPFYMKTSKALLAKYYQENKERLQIKAPERYQNLPKKEKEKKQHEGYKISQKMKKLS